MATELRTSLARLSLPLPLEPLVWSVVATSDADVRAERVWLAWDAAVRITAAALWALCRHAGADVPAWDDARTETVSSCVERLRVLGERGRTASGSALVDSLLDALDADVPSEGALARFAAHARLLGGERGDSHLGVIDALAALAPASGLHPVVLSAGADAALEALLEWLERVPPCAGAETVVLAETTLAGETVRATLLPLARNGGDGATHTWPATPSDPMQPGRGYLRASDGTFIPLAPVAAIDDGAHGLRVGWLRGRADDGVAEYETYLTGAFRVAPSGDDLVTLFGAPPAGVEPERPAPRRSTPRRMDRVALGLSLMLASGAGAGWVRAYRHERVAASVAATEHAARVRAEHDARTEHEARVVAEASARDERSNRLRAEELIDAQGFSRPNGFAGAPGAAVRGARPAVVVRPGGEAQAVVAGIFAVGPAVADGEAPAGAAVDALSNAVMALRRSFPIHTRAGDRFAATTSSDGRRVLTVTDDGRARIWDAGHRAISASLRPQPADVVSAVFSPDGARLLLFESPRDASLWDAQSGRLLARLAPDAGGVRAAVFSPDGTRVASAGGDGIVRLFETRNGHAAGELAGHEGAVRALAFSADSSRLITAGEDATARIWDLASAHQTARVATHGAVGWKVAFSPDGQSAVVASAPDVVESPDGTVAAGPGNGGARAEHSIQIFDPATGTERSAIDAESHPLLPFAFGPDGARLATATLGALHGVELWDPHTGTRIARLSEDVSRLSALAFASDASRLLTMDGTDTRVWDAPTGREQQRLDVRASPEGAVAVFSPDGQHVFAAAGSAGDGVYSVETGEREALLRGNTGGVRAAEFSPEGDKLITAGADHTVRVWETDGGEISDTLQGHAGEVYLAHFAAEGRVITASRDGTVRVWGDRGGQSLYAAHGAVAEFTPDGESVLLAGSGPPRLVHARTGATSVTFAAAVQGARAARFLGDGARAAIVDRHGAITVWDASAGRVLSTLGSGAESREARVDFSADGTRVFEAFSDGTAELWDVSTGTRTGSYPSELFHATTLALSPDGARTVTEDNAGEVAGYDARTGAKLWHVAPDPNAAAPDHVVFTPDGLRVLATSPDESVKLYDAQTGALVQTLDEFASGAAFSPDGGRVALVLDGDGRSATNGTNQQFVRVWDLGSQRIVATLDGHPGAISAVRFSRDGTRLATASDDRSVRVWDAASGALLATLQGREEMVSAEFSPDGLLLRAAGPDGVAQIFPATAEGVLMLGCRLIRPLPEWDQVRRYCDPAIAHFQ